MGVVIHMCKHLGHTTSSFVSVFQSLSLRLKLCPKDVHIFKQITAPHHDTESKYMASPLIRYAKHRLPLSRLPLNQTHRLQRPLSSWSYLDLHLPASLDCRSISFTQSSSLNSLNPFKESCFTLIHNRFSIRTTTTATTTEESSSRESDVRPEDGKREDNFKQSHSGDYSSSKDGSKDEQKEDLEDEKTQVLRAALAHVPKLGWSEAALVAGARDVGLSPAIIGALPRKEAALVEYFMDESLEKLLDEVENCKDELANMVISQRLAKLVRLRLEMQIPFISRWPQALSIQANPLDFPTVFKQRAVLIDEIWHAAGDRSSDMDWYTKRGLLAGVYTATELYMLTDHSPGFKDTWAFLEKRIKDVIECRKTAQEAAHLAQAVSSGLANTLESFFKR